MHVDREIMWTCMDRDHRVHVDRDHRVHVDRDHRVHVDTNHQDFFGIVENGVKCKMVTCFYFLFKPAQGRVSLNVKQ